LISDFEEIANVVQARCSLFCATHSHNKSKQTMAPRSKQRKKNPKFIDWRNSSAKKAILFDLADGVLDPETSPDDAWDVYKQRDEFAGVCWEQFKPHFEAHCKAFKKKREQSEKEELAFQHDHLLHPCDKTHDSRGRLMFSRHPAKDLLRHDIAMGLYPNLYTPMQLWNLRPEYKQFELKVFTQRIYQEIRRNKFINWCNKKRQEKGEEHAEHRRKRDYTFD
jgi:hypothetical protein